jgi:type 1 glutamine amidotransferase
VPFMTSDRMKVMEKQMQRGCGIVTIHYTTFITYAFVDQILEWQGGYYEWKGPVERRSAIKTLETDLKLGAPEHPISSGLQPFTFKDEYYYKLRFRENDPRLKPILQVPALSEVPEQQIVAWAVERQGGGRGFATTTGHFFDNWKNDSYRKLMLNAILWTAGGDVSPGGVQSAYLDPNDVDQALMTKPIPTLLVTGGDHSAAIISALNSETPRFQVKVVDKLEPEDFSRYKLILVSHCDLPSLGLTANGRKRLMHYLKRGGGLSLIRSGLDKITRPAHEPNAVYRIRMEDSTHPVTAKIDPFETTDQFSADPVDGADRHVLAVAQLKAGGPDQPVASIHTYLKGRIFQTVLGRDVSALQIPGTVQLIRYGSLWAAEGK